FRYAGVMCLMPEYWRLTAIFSRQNGGATRNQAREKGPDFFVALDENVSYYQKVTAMMVSSWWGKGHRRDTPSPAFYQAISYPRTLRSGLHPRQSRRGVALSLPHQIFLSVFQRLPSGRAR
ncbi:MAG: hypothetical protein ABF946_03300, partial [Acetobacter papayae]